MRHLKAGVHLGRTSAHRKALFSNLVAALFTHERIHTTHAKAKATRRIAERAITKARRLGDILTKSADTRSAVEASRVVHAVRLTLQVVRNRDAVLKLFDQIAPRYLSRPGGYTRIIKVGPRPGDSAPISILELVSAEEAPEIKGTATKGTATKGTAKGKAVATPAKAAKTPVAKKSK
jgi:large subunit ribosomal protein L17